jgi:hypothetical protein
LALVVILAVGLHGCIDTLNIIRLAIELESFGGEQTVFISLTIARASDVSRAAELRPSTVNLVSSRSSRIAVEEIGWKKQ